LGDIGKSTQKEESKNVNVHVKKHYRLEMRLRVEGMRGILWQLLWTLVAMHVMAMVRLQHGVTANLFSTTHILQTGIKKMRGTRPMRWP
jgi:hypothetical protein